MSLAEFLDLVFRWVHLVAGIMWIGNSMLWNWLDRNLVPGDARGRKGYQGQIWMVHSGAFYSMEKLLLEPGELPRQLHWFKWQNGITWLSGMSLLVVVYYLHDGAFLVDPAVSTIAPLHATALALGVVVASWAVYDQLWKRLGARPRLAGAVSLVLLGIASYGFTLFLSGRAAYIHTGVLMGTLMTGNVWMVILPSQRELIRATTEGREQDEALSLRAKERSIHNNYMTFPLLFIMVSNHFPSTYGHELRWLLLAVLMVAGAVVRHFMNIRFVYARWLPPALGTVVVASALLFGLTARKEARADGTAPVPFAEVKRIVEGRCVSCHAAKPTDPSFGGVPPLGVLLETPEQLQAMAVRIRERVVVQKTMPFVNKTGMSDEERETLGRWVEQGAPLE